MKKILELVFRHNSQSCNDQSIPPLHEPPITPRETFLLSLNPEWLLINRV